MRVFVEGSSVTALLDSDWSDYEDATQHQAAIDAKSDVIITRNIKDFSNSVIKVMTPVEFLTQQKLFHQSD